MEKGDFSEFEFSEEQVAEMRQNFALFDKDGNGSVSLSELAIMVRSLGGYPTEAQLQQMIDDADQDGNGCIDFPEFVRLMHKEREMASKSADLAILDAFVKFDKNGSGCISAEELKHAMLNLGEKLTDDEVDSMLKVADIDGDGQINYMEFAEVLRS